MVQVKKTGKILELKKDNCFDFSSSAPVVKEGTQRLRKPVALPIQIPNSEHNKSALKFAKINKPTEIELLGSDFELYLKTRSDKSKNIIADLKSKEWFDCFENLRLCDLDLGTYEFTEANVSYNVGDAHGSNTNGVFANFGDWGFINDSTVVTEDNRLFLHPWFLLEKAFEHCCTELKAPIYDTTRQAHRWLYLLKPDFYDYEGHGRLIYGKTTISTDTLVQPSFGGVAPFTQDVIVSDLGGNITLVNSSPGIFLPSYNNTTLGDNFKKCVCIKGCLNSSIGQQVFISVVTSVVTDNYPLNLSIGDNDIDICIDLDGSNPVEVTILSLGAVGVTIKEGTCIEITGKNKFHYQGDIIKINEIIDCSITALDLLVDEMLEYCGMHDDSVSGCVTLTSAYNVDDNGEKLTGFYRDKVTELTPVCNSKSESQLAEPNRYIKYCYKPSTDSFINEIETTTPINNIKEKDEFFTYIVDREFNNLKSSKNCNKLYEPTRNNFNFDVSVDNNFPVWLAQFSDNTDGEISYNIAPRSVFIFVGRQCFAGVETQLVYDNNNIDTFPTTYMEIPANIEIKDNPDWNGQQYTKEENYNLYCKEFNEKQGANPAISFCFVVDLKLYNKVSFRDKFLVMYKGESHYLRLANKQGSDCEKVQEWSFIEENISC